MSSYDGTFTFDPDGVLSPISAERPAGESLRYEPVYDELRELRRQDDPSLPQGEWKTELKKAEWNRVAELSVELLETRSKDLQLAVWVAEAWIHEHGFRGAEQGLALVRRLCEDFWADLHPDLDEDGSLGLRSAALGWLDQGLARALKQVPVTWPEGDDAHPCSWADWELAQHLGKAKREEQEEAEARGRVTREKFLVSSSLTPAAFFRQQLPLVEGAQDALVDLRGALDAQCGDESPGMAAARQGLEEIHSFVARNLRERQGEDNEQPEEEEEAEIDLGEERRPRPGSGPIRSRAEAYRRLSEASEYLLRTEPHSPAPYLVKRAVAWGNLTLAELLSELLEQNADLDAIYRLLGMKPSEHG